jgi:tetrahydroxynaphthalene reductase
MGIMLMRDKGRGIGREMALELGRRGAKVAVNYANSSESANEVVAAIRASGSDAIAIKAIVSVVKDIISLFAQTVAHFGELNIVCSNSGVVSFGHVKDVTEEEYDRVMGINTRGQFFVAREAYKHLSIGGRLIMMGSITGQAKGVPKHTLYSGSKGAIETFIRCMAIGMYYSSPFSLPSFPLSSPFGLVTDVFGNRYGRQENHCKLHRTRRHQDRHVPRRLP